jgi:hypothetical protein
MPTSTDVNLPRSHKPKFPDRCVICNRENPKSKMRYKAGTLGWTTILFWSFGKRFVVYPPTCKPCGRKVHVFRILRLVVTILSVSLMIFWVWPLCKEHVDPRIEKWAMMGLAVIAMLPQVAYEVFLPRPFDISPFKKSVDYEFASADNAVDFAMENLDAAWVKVNDHDIQE